MIFSLESTEAIHLMYKHSIQMYGDIHTIQMYGDKKMKLLLRQLQYSWGKPKYSEKR